MADLSNIYEQLKNKCNCTQDISDNDIDELINLVSMATCWTSSPCETFLIGDRKEILDLPDCKDACGVFEYRPFYSPFNKESFTFKVIVQEGAKEDVIELENVFYSEIDECFKLELPIKDCKCDDFFKHTCLCNTKCGCDVKYKLLVEYEAGFNELPECLIPVFCGMLDLVHKRRQCDCSCETCGDDNYENKLDFGSYTTGDVITPTLVSEFSDILSKQYKDQLSLISLCRDERFFGKVI